jgi:hypothetical protein
MCTHEEKCPTMLNLPERPHSQEERCGAPTRAYLTRHSHTRRPHSPLSYYKECNPLNTLECLNPKTLQTLKHTEAIQREQYVRRNRNMFGRSPCAHMRRSAQQCSICQSGRTHRRSGAEHPHEHTSLAIATRADLTRL